MPKYLVFGDLHFASSGAVTEEYTEKLDICINTCEWIADQIRENKPDWVINLGDVNHALGYVDIITLEAMREGMERVNMACRDLSILHVILSGNHDQYSKDGSFTVVNMFGSIRAVGGWSLFNDKSFAIIDYHKDESSFYTALGECRECPILFMHQDIKGTLIGPKSYMPTGITIAALEAFKIVFNGHLHYPSNNQSLDTGTLIINVGSPIYHNFTDYVHELERGIVVYDSDKGHGLESITRIPNPCTPYYHTVKSREELDEFKAKELDLSRVNLRVVTEHDNLLKVVADNKHAYKSTKLIKQTSKENVEVGEVDVGMSPLMAVKSYVQHADTDLNKDDLFKIGQEILTEAT